MSETIKKGKTVEIVKLDCQTNSSTFSLVGNVA